MDRDAIEFTGTDSPGRRNICCEKSVRRRKRLGSAGLTFANKSAKKSPGDIDKGRVRDQMGNERFKISIRALCAAELTDALPLIWDVFSQYEAPQYTESRRFGMRYTTRTIWNSCAPAVPLTRMRLSASLPREAEDNTWLCFS